MSLVKVAVYSTKHYDSDSLKAASAETARLHPVQIEFTYFEPRLSLHTVPLAKGHDAVCIFVNDEANRTVLEGLKALGIRCIALRCAGFNNVDLAAASELGITVARVPAYSPEAVAEFAVGMILTVVRKYHKAYNRVREGNFLLEGLLGFNICQSTVGIIGTGKIGLLTGKILSRGFGARVIGYDPYPNPPAAAEHGIAYVSSLQELLRESDIITIHCPLLPSTKYIINDSAISEMKPGVILVNTSRGGLIDTAALIRGLKDGKVKAVGLDVYEKESEYFFEDGSSAIMQDDLLARLISFNNVFISGHQAFLTKEALSSIASTTISNLESVCAGVECPNVVRAS